MTHPQSRKIFISAAETSGDQHAAKLVRQLRKDLPQFPCEGLGGPALADAGCNLLENLIDRSAMLLHALGQIPFYFRLLARVKHHFNQNRPDLVVLIDSPAWNFHIARAAHQRHIPVLYYIPPQLWAWGAWRIAKLRRNIDRVACILPFEQQWFTERGVPAQYVGHPLFDEPHPVSPIDPATPLSNHFPTIALLPGSRRQEIHHLWPPMQKIAARIRAEYPNARFLTAASNATNADFLRDKADPELGIEIRRTSIEATCRHADLTLVASGTATLEVAAQNCPMIIMYHVHPLQWHLAGRWLVKTPYLSLVNILANKELVPEFMPFYRQVDPVSEVALSLLKDDPQRQQMRLALRELMAPIIQPGAAQRVIEIIREMLPQY